MFVQKLGNAGSGEASPGEPWEGGRSCRHFHFGQGEHFVLSRLLC